MLKRFALVAFSVIALAPSLALADDTAPTSTPTPTPANPTQDASGAAGLGPQTQLPGASTGSAQLLQPTGQSSLQSTDPGNQAASSNQLQAPATGTDQLKVLLAGEGDDAPQNLDDTSGLSATDDVVLGIVLLALIAGFVVRRKQLAAAFVRPLGRKN